MSAAAEQLPNEVLWRGKCLCTKTYTVTVARVDGRIVIDHEGTPCHRFAAYPPQRYLRWVRLGRDEQ